MRVLLTFSLAFAAASAALLLGLPVGFGLGVLLLTAGTTLAVLRRVPRAAVICLGLAAGILWTYGYETLHLAPVSALSGETILISGTATDYSTETAYGVRVPAKVQVGEIKTTAMVWLYTDEFISPGDVFSVTAELKIPDDSTYDYRTDGIFLLAYGQGTPEISHAEQIPAGYWPRTFAHRLEMAIRECVRSDVRGYALALSTGNRTELSSLQREQMKTAGIYHMLALSGMHMTTLVGMLSLLIRRKRLRALVGIPVCILFTVITGANASLVRACVMECFVLSAPLVGREEDSPTVLGAAGLVLMLQNPWCILGWDTQLSFASMTGILLLSEKISKNLYERKPRWKWRRRLRWTVVSSLSATLSATAVAAPLMMAYFGMISLVSPLSNLLTGWMVSWCFRGSLLTGLVGMAWPGLGRMLGWALGWGFRYIGLVTGLLSKIPFAALYTNTVYAIAWVTLCYGMLYLLILTPKAQRNAVIPTCCIVAGLAVCIVFSMMENTQPVFTVLDVGQGQCVIARMDGQTVMIDCGGSYDAGSVAAAYLDSLGEQRVDLLLLTHYDSDHTGGVGELLERVTVGTLMLPDHEPESEIRQDIEDLAKRMGIEVLLVQEDTAASVGDIQVSVFASRSGSSENNAGLAVLLDMGSLNALVTGDMDTLGETILLGNHALPDVDVLVAGHHGSKYSTSQQLLETVTPEVVAISVGSNSYGHPAAETLSRIAETGAAVYRTDQNGTIRIKGA